MTNTNTDSASTDAPAVEREGRNERGIDTSLAGDGTVGAVLGTDGRRFA